MVREQTAAHVTIEDYEHTTERGDSTAGTLCLVQICCTGRAFVLTLACGTEDSQRKRSVHSQLQRILALYVRYALSVLYGRYRARY